LSPSHDQFYKRRPPWYRRVDYERFLEGLRKAGLTELRIAPQGNRKDGSHVWIWHVSTVFECPPSGRCWGQTGH
jgi:hypothetical protein